MMEPIPQDLCSFWPSIGGKCIALQMQPLLCFHEQLQIASLSLAFVDMVQVSASPQCLPNEGKNFLLH